MKGTSEARQSAHPHVFWKVPSRVSREAWSMCGTPPLHPPGLHLPSRQEQSSRRAGPGRWGGSDAPRESLGARWPRSPAGRGSLRLWAKIVPPFLHSSSAAHPTVPITTSFVSAAIFLLPWSTAARNLGFHGPFLYLKQMFSSGIV